MNRLKRKEADRPRAFWGSLISAGVGIASALLNSKAQEKQRRLQANLEDYNNSLKEAQSMTNALNAGQDYQQNYLQQFKQQARLGTTRRLGSRNIMITDGGNAKKIGNNTYLLRGGSHEDINETGQTRIGINVGGNEIEAEGGEVAQRKGNSLRIYSAQPILGGMSPAQAIIRGYNKDKVFNAQQRFKKNNGIKDDGSRQRNGGEVPYNHYDPTGLFGGSPHPLAKMIDITGITSYGDVKKLIDKKKRGEIPTTQEYLGALSAIPAIGRIAKVLSLIGNVADATTFMKDVKESEAKENAYQNEVVKYMDIHGKIKTGRRGSMPYSAHELRKRLGGRAKARIGIEKTYEDENKTNITTSNLNGAEYLSKIISGAIMQGGRLLTGNSKDKSVSNNVAQDTYLMPFRLGQGRAFKDAGYDRDYQSEKKRDYGLVQKAVGNENIPIYSRVNNPEKRKELIQIYNPESTYNPNIKYPLIHAAFHPSSLYIDGTNGNVMYKGWDLNDYGTDKGGKGFSSYYGSIRKVLANTLDVFGNPTVVTTGYQNVLDNDGKPMNIFKGNYKDDFNANIAVSDFIVKQLLKKENPSFVNEYGMSPVPEVVITAPRKKHRLGGGLTSKDRGSSKHPYPSVASKDFAGGNRSYPIPTKADAIDALRLAGLHGRSDVRSKVYNKYPELRKKAEIGTNISLYSSYDNKDFLHRITQGHPTARKIINEIFGDEADRRRFMQDLNIFGYGSEDASSIAGASPIFRQPIVSAARQAQFIQDANKARQAANANRARQAANYAQQQVDYIKELSDRMSATIRNVGEQLGIRVNPNPNNSVRRLYSSNFKPTNNRITTPRETPMNSSNSSMETPINSTTTSATNKPTYSGKTTKFNTKYRSYRNAGFSPRTSKNLVKANKVGLYSTIGGFGTIGAGTLIGANINKTDKPTSTQKDAKGQPISPYIARPKKPAKPQAKKSVPARKDTIATKPATRQVPTNIARKDTTRTDTTRTDTTKQVNKVVKRQVRTTPQYTGNTTKGNYQLHDGETKVINGVKYTRRGNTIINHKTNVGYIYDKNGNYTGQADYSKVGNFNQAFDAARAAGRNQFIYRAGKYNNYSTVKETNAKKEALNRRIGARRIAKRMGCLTNPPVERFKCGGRIRPKAEDGMLAPVYSYGINRRKLPSFAPIDVTPRAIPNFKPVSVPTNTKTPFDPNRVPYLGKQSSFKPTTQDYIGLGIDTLASLGIGLINSSAAGKTYLPERPAIIQASKLPTYYNVSPQVEEIKRQRDILNGEIANNTSSSVAALNRISRIRGTATGEINKLYATKENEENKMLTQDALNQQQVAAENAKLQADYENNKANIINAASQAKANALSGTLSGLSQAWTNFASSIENRYNNRQNETIIAATAKDPAVLSNAIQFGYNFSPEILAGVYNSTKDENLKDLVLSQLNNKNRRKYGIK